MVKSLPTTLISSLAFLLISPSVHAAAGVTYYGRLLKANGQPVTESHVTFRVQVRSIGSENCLLYEETQIKDLSTSNGIFALTLNDGSGTISAGNLSLDRAFQNRGTLTFAAGKCSMGNSYQAHSYDGRRLLVDFNDESFVGWESMPSQTVNYVPLAIEAMTVGGFGAENLLRVEDGGVPQNLSPLTQAQFGKLLDVANGAGDIGGNSAGFNGSLGGDVSGNQGTTQVIGLRGRALSGTAPTDGQVLVWNAGGNTWQPGTASGGSGGVTSLSGDVSTTGTGALTVQVDRIKNVAVSATPPTAGQVLKFAGGSWTPSDLQFSDVKNGLGASAFNVGSCTAGQTVSWSSLTDAFTCADIQITGAQISGLSACGAGNKMRWDGSVWQCEADNASDSSKVSKTGDTMSGSLTLTSGTLTVAQDATIGLLTVGRGAAGINSNTVVGMSAFTANGSGMNDTAVGTMVLAANTTGNANSGVGSMALMSNTTGNQNAAFGVQALNSSISGGTNSAFGFAALYGNTTGNGNTALGANAGAFDSTSANNATSGNSLYLGANSKPLASGDTNEVVIGWNAAGNGSNSVTLGNSSITKTVLRGNVGIGTTNPTSSLTVVGGDALINGVAIGRGGGSLGNTALGTSALRDNTTGVSNTAVGSGSMLTNTGGGFNTAVGQWTLYYNTTGSNNTAVGYQAGGGSIGLTANSNSVFLGYNANPSAGGTTNEIVIGANATGNGSNSVTIGTAGTTKTVLQGNVGVGTASPTVALDVNGAVRAGPSTAVTTCGAGAANGEGSQRYNYTTHSMEYCNGTGWVNPEGGSSAAAWVHFDGTTGTILASYNVASVTRTSVGHYTITLSGALADSNYAVVGSATGNTNGGAVAIGTADASLGTRTSSSFQIFTSVPGTGTGTGAYDALRVSLVVYR